MKLKLIVIVMILSFVTTAFGQTVITLKSGEIIEGNVTSLINGILKISFKGNPINIKQSELKSIDFVKEDLKTIASNKNLSNGELKGVVTYYFNKNYGDKPDVGAKIYVRKTDTTGRKQSPTAKYERAAVLKYLVDNKVDVEKYSSQLKEMNGDTKAGFDELSSAVIKDMYSIERDETAKIVTADGNGSYSVKLSPGLYEVIITSKGRTSLTVAEINGKIATKIISIKSDDVKTIDYRFGL
ncbi:hypothetical protein EZ456_17860 [Pedobacter psychrodurus]|uniref:Carboxypeptidase family protein n=1 Tax=Pedobacter psychrodurus TaxID=2530456 RepID=A0A4R0PRZ7_9SPHI|nr:hypothetical protein [Pedobacter psychrodurus]TCD22008.1 hypothetical protein EZ456_17860 [Pedobacter psychrodurus]